MQFRALSFLVVSTLSTHLYAQDLNFDSVLSDELLPTGRQVVIAETRIGSGTTYFNNQSQEQPLFSALSNLSLATDLLIPLLGTTQLSSKLSGQRVNFTYGYGLSENLTAGFIVGWGKLTNQVSFSVIGAGSPAADAFSAATVQSALTSNYGYKPITTAVTEGILDPQIGVRWRVAKSEKSSTIIVPAIRIGMATYDDSDNLMDVHLTDGSSALMLAAEQRYRLRVAELRAYVQYTLPLADKFQARPYAAGGSPLVAQAATETLDRKVGGMWKMELEGAKRWNNWRAMARMEYSRTATTHYTSHSGQAVSGLEMNTEGWDVVVRTGVSWNRFSDYLAKQSGLPVMLAVEYSSMLDGRNVPQSDNVYLTATLPF
ncbi:MAG: hypothetical protein ABL911_09885 [Gallionella sp.]